MKSLNDAIGAAAIITGKSGLDHSVYKSRKGYAFQQSSIFPGKNPDAIVKKESDKKVCAYDQDGKKIRSISIEKGSKNKAKPEATKAKKSTSTTEDPADKQND